MNYLHGWILLCLSMFLAIITVSASQDSTKNNILDDDISRVPRGWQDSTSLWGKRGWQDSSSGWGKRSWSNLQGSYGKRGWERLKPTWGKRSVLDEQDSEESSWDGIEKRPETDWKYIKGAWGKRNVGNGWSSMRGLWGKRNGGVANMDEDFGGELN